MRRRQMFLSGALVAFATSPSQAATTYDYDTLGRLSSATYDNNKQIVYHYDQAGNRTQVVIQTPPPHGAPARTAKVAKKKGAKARH